MEAAQIVPYAVALALVAWATDRAVKWLGRVLASIDDRRWEIARARKGRRVAKLDRRCDRWVAAGKLARLVRLEPLAARTDLRVEQAFERSSAAAEAKLPEYAPRFVMPGITDKRRRK